MTIKRQTNPTTYVPEHSPDWLSADDARVTASPPVEPPAEDSHYDNKHPSGWTPEEIAALARAGKS